MHATLPLLEQSDFPPIFRHELTVLQVNLGYLCNLSCTHCHVNAGPKRTELMDEDTIERVLQFIASENIKILDLTGGAPEMNPHFRELVRRARQLRVQVIDRCNLVILQEPGYEDMAAFLADNQVEITASLPCYLEDNVDRQRGKGTFGASIKALQALNALGYGQEHGGLRLNLVFNPQGPVLPPAQQPLQQAYKEHLRAEYGIEFNQLYVMANLPIQRFGSMLIGKGQFKAYLQLLKDHHRPENLAQVMCRNTLSIDWQGFIYDCDFNQMLQLPLGAAEGRIHLRDVAGRDLRAAPINVRQHCFGCTAGQGSSCGGALV